MTAGPAADPERRLSDVLSEFAGTLVTDFAVQDILDHLVVRMVDVLPVSGAGITLISDGSGPQHIAASDKTALRFEQLQSELREGPCITAYETGEAVLVTDVASDHRFPRFTSQAGAAGLGAVFTFPLRENGGRLGALDLYRGTPGSLDARAVVTAQTLADVAAAYLLNAQVRANLRESSAQARREALHDPLTKLPNRTLLVQRLDHAIVRCRRSSRMVAILFADLDGFKTVNDTYGHAMGDGLLVAVGERLTRLIRPGDTLARLAGDEFVVLCEDLEDTAQADTIAERIAAAFSDPFTLGEVEIRARASVGIAFAGPGADSSEDVLNNADAAMYSAKRDGGGRHSNFDHHEQRLARYRAGLNGDMRRAMEEGDLTTKYRPIRAVTDGSLTGIQAVLVWNHPLHGAVPAETIRELAEHSGLIIEIGRRALIQALCDHERWRDAGAVIATTLQISTQELLIGGFAASVVSALVAGRVEPSSLTLAVSTGVFGANVGRSLAVLDDLTRVGVRIALDGFGTGLSALSYLKRAPVDIVKLAPNFSASLGEDREGQIIVTALADLAHNLGLVVEADGVDTDSQRRALLEAGCDRYQGTETLTALEVGAILRQGPDQDGRRTSTFPPATRTS